jgi:hypothetical protein
MAQKSTIILSTALVVVLIAFGYYFFMIQSQVAGLNSQISTLNSQLTNQQTQTTQGNLNITLTKADTFDARLHDLLQEHTFLLINTIRRSLDSSASFNASLVALQNNINEVGTLLTPIYGSNASQLVNLWNNKTTLFLNYSNAVKSGDLSANATFASVSTTYEASAATFWATTQNPYPAFDYNTMLQMVTAHMNDVKAAVDAWNSKDYPTYFNDLEIAYNQMGQYADTIAQGIIIQNPQDFQ